MKKTIASGMIGLLAFGGTAAVAAPAAFAQDAEQSTEDLTREERRAERQAEREARKAERLAELSEILGMSVEEIEAAHEADQTIADMAAAQGLDLQSVIDALVVNSQARIDAKVAAGELDADRAAEFSESLTERITARVNGERPEGAGRGGPGGRGHHGPRGERGSGTDAEAADTADTSTADTSEATETEGEGADA